VGLESIEAEDEDWCGFVKLHLLHSITMSLALAAVPTVALAEPLRCPELLQTVLNRGSPRLTGGLAAE